MNLFNNERGSSQKLLVDSHRSSSNAEQTIQRVDSHHLSLNSEQAIRRYSASDTLPTPRPLVTKTDVLNYSKNPCNGYVSN